MNKIRAQIIEARPYSEGSTAMHITAAKTKFVNGQIIAEEPLDFVLVPQPWHGPQGLAAYATELVGQIGVITFQTDRDKVTGIIPNEVGGDQKFIEFFQRGC